MFLAAIASFVFAVDSFRRLNKCLENHDRLGITRKQITINIGVFFISLCSIGLLMGSVVKADSKGANINTEADILQFMIRMDDACLGLFVISSIPVVYIVNSLLNKAIQDALEQKNQKLEFERLVESVELNDSISPRISMNEPQKVIPEVVTQPKT